MREEEARIAADSLRATQELRRLEREERIAAEEREKAQREAKEKLNKAREMGEFIKKAALKEQLQQNKQKLKDELQTTQELLLREEASREFYQAKLFANNSRAMGALNKLRAEEADAKKGLDNVRARTPRSRLPIP